MSVIISTRIGCVVDGSGTAMVTHMVPVTAVVVG